MHIQAHDNESLRKLVRLLEQENRILKEKLKRENIPFDDVNLFEEVIENEEEYDSDQGGRINSPGLDVLMLAAPVSFEGRLEQYVGRLNRDYIGKEAVYVYDYIDSHMRFFNKMYGKRLRTYKKMGFSIWTEEVTTKQVANAIYDSGNYMEMFERDLVEAGVTVSVITTNPENIVYGSADVCHELIVSMRQVGIQVVTKDEVEEHFAVMDDELVWHGGMNLLCKVDVWDNLMRIKDCRVAAELLEIGVGEK